MSTHRHTHTHTRTHTHTHTHNTHITHTTHTHARTHACMHTHICVVKANFSINETKEPAIFLTPFSLAFRVIRSPTTPTPPPTTPTQEKTHPLCTHLSSAVSRLGVFGGDAGENHVGAPQAAINLFIQ